MAFCFEYFKNRHGDSQFFSCILVLQTWTINKKIIKKFCNAIFFPEAKITVSSITFFWHYRIFYNISIDCSCLKKKYASKKMGVNVLIFEKRKAKGQFEGKLLRLWCYSNYLSCTKNNEVQIRNTNLTLSTSICQMKFKHAKSESVKLPYT